MIDIGIDFGSTYTIVSVYRHDLEKPETVSLSEGDNAAIPTVYSCRQDGTKEQIGWAAKDSTALNIKKYRAFKMMLSEDDKEVLKERGFDEKYTPEAITKKYISGLLEKVLNRENDKIIGNLVLGAPEVWYDAFSTIDGRTKLRDICRSLPYFANNKGNKKEIVRIVSEPAAASTYFAYNYKQIKNKTFDGNILLIDYGGGTLDISLTEVIPSSDGNFEIRVLNHAGAGENEQKGEIGQAGIIYMESLTKAAIKANYPDIEEIALDEDFFECVNSVEKALMSSTDDIDEIISEFGTSPDDLEEDRMDEEYYFTKVYYAGKKVMITYQIMAEVYDKVIRPVFDAKMKEFIQYMDNAGIDWKNRTNEKFKIVLVGGFGNFAFVKAQMKECFGISHNDNRQKDILLSNAECEKAISLGCTILASNTVSIRNTAPIGIGVLTVPLGDKKKKYNLSYGLRYHQEIEFNKEYIQKRNENAGPEYIYLNGIERLLVDTGKGPLPLSLKPKFINLIKNAAEKSFFAYIGFSLDPSGVVTLYIHDYDHINKVETNVTPIELASYKSLFDTQSIDERELEYIRASV